MARIAKRRDEAEQQGDALSRLVNELGRAARDGWGTTARLVVLLVVVCAGIAVLLAVGR
jgi:hypothetical protein